MMKCSNICGNILFSKVQLVDVMACFLHHCLTLLCLSPITFFSPPNPLKTLINYKRKPQSHPYKCNSNKLITWNFALPFCVFHYLCCCRKTYYSICLSLKERESIFTINIKLTKIILRFTL